MSADDRDAARVLAAQAQTHVGHASGQGPARTVLRWVTRGRLRGPRGRPVVADLGTPWQDTPSAERPGWRERAAYFGGKEVFAVDYQTCRRCALGWVEQPYTGPEYQRCGPAAAALAALRAEYPGVAWHTLGGHFRESGPFWLAAGAGVPGGYRQRGMCPHRGHG